MKVWQGCSTSSEPCAICGRMSGDYAEFKTEGVCVKLHACAGHHLAYVQRSYAQALIKPLLIQARVIAHGRPGQADKPQTE